MCIVVKRSRLDYLFISRYCNGAPGWLQTLVDMQRWPSTPIYISAGIRNGPSTNQQTNHGHLLLDLPVRDSSYARFKTAELTVLVTRLLRHWMLQQWNVFTALWPLDFCEQISKFVKRNRFFRYRFSSKKWRKFYPNWDAQHLKENKFPFPMTCFSNVSSTVMFSRSIKLHFWSCISKKKKKMRNFNFCKTCVYISIVQNIFRQQASAAMEFVLVKQFAVNNHYTYSYEATSSSMFVLNSLHYTIIKSNLIRLLLHVDIVSVACAVQWLQRMPLKTANSNR
jgi:hypothetical protein